MYGPHGTWEAGANAAAGRDLPQGHRRDGLGQARDRDLGRRDADARSFMYVDDCVKGIDRITQSNILGRSTWLERAGEHQPAGGHRRGDRRHLQPPLQARRARAAGRNSDNTKIQGYLRWEPDTRLRRHGKDLPLDLRRVHGQVRREDGTCRASARSPRARTRSRATAFNPRAAIPTRGKQGIPAGYNLRAAASAGNAAKKTASAQEAVSQGERHAQEAGGRFGCRAQDGEGRR